MHAFRLRVYGWKFCHLERPTDGQHRKEVLSKDSVADDKFLSGINFYVKGVDGKVPGGK